MTLVATTTTPGDGERAHARVNKVFLQKAEDLKPVLSERLCRPLSVIKFEPSPKAFFKCKAVSIHSSSELPNLSYGKGEQLTLDFGSHCVGYLSFRLGVDGIIADTPARLRLTFGEAPYDVTETLNPSPSWISTSWIPDETISVDWPPTDVVLSRRYAFRYLRIEVLDTSPNYRARFLDVKVRAVSAVSEEVAAAVQPLISNDKDLLAIDRISQLTLRECMQTVFEDGPRRDRRLWLGDIRLQALTNYCTFKDFSLIRRCLYLFAAFPREDQSLPACIYEKPTPQGGADYVVDYSALFGPTLYDYALASGDLRTAEELWPTALASMKNPLSHLDLNGRFNSGTSTYWKFLDWSDGLDTNAGMHGVVLYSCKQINKLAVLLSKSPPFIEIAKTMSAAAETFHDKHLGVFVSGPSNQVSWISQAWLGLAGVMSPNICLRAITTAMADPRSLKPLTPYAYHHVAQALSECGGEKQCLKLMREYWGGMATAGADTFWECFDPNDSRRTPYGDVHNNSYCHAWSCTPSYLLRVVLKKHLDK